MIDTKQYTVVDMQDMPKEIKGACFAYFNGRANGGFYKPNIDGCPLNEDFITDYERESLIYEFGDTDIYPVSYDSEDMNQWDVVHCILIIYLFKELELSFDDVKAWDRILINFWY